MKKLTYKMNEKNIIFRSLYAHNLTKKSEIEKIISDLEKEHPFNDYTLELKFDDGRMYQKFINNITGDIIYQYNKLPVTIRELYHKLFDKLYWKYCN